MVVDFQHHYVPVELAKKRGLYSDRTTYLQEDGRRATTRYCGRGGIAAVKDRLLAKGYRFGTLKRSFADYFDMLYFDLARFEGGLPALHCALQGIRPERLVFASDYPQDFTGVNTDTGKGMQELRNYIAISGSSPAERKPRRGS